MTDADKLRAAVAAADAGRWDEAHTLVQDLAGAQAAWIHANLHREEGDADNARYWYSRAGRPVSTLGFSAEREEIAAALASLTNC